jgi:predicted lipoprotein with Yx(FWY)xxD motif
MRSFMAIVALGVAALVAAGGTAAEATRSAAAQKTIVISTRTVPKLGAILVDGRGRTLYMFVPDKRKRVTCVHVCAAVWPPVKLPKGAKARAKGKARPSLLGSDRNPAGGRVVTYHGWPLYTYVADTAKGQVKGQALDLNGGLWYVLSPAGKVLRKKI